MRLEFDRAVSCEMTSSRVVVDETKSCVWQEADAVAQNEEVSKEEEVVS